MSDKRVLACAHDSECSVLGAILVHPATYADVADVLHPHDFDHGARRAIYEAIVELDKAGRPLDVATIAQQLRVSETLDQLRTVGGEDYLLQLTQWVASLETVRYHAIVVAQRARRRRLAHSIGELHVAAFDGHRDDEDFFGQLDRTVAEWMHGSTLEGGPREVPKILKEVVKDLAVRYEKKQRGELVEMPGVTTGQKKVDDLLGGLQEAKLYVLGARPGMGKTALVLNWSQAASRAMVPVLGFSLEMLDREMVTRMLSTEARVDGKAIERVNLSQRDWNNLMRGGESVSQYPMQIDHTSSLTFDQIRSRARRWRMKHPRDQKGNYTQKALVWVDYLQLIFGAREDDNRRPENRQQEIARISGGLKQLAKELQCPVVALSQLNRGLESRDDKRPRLSDLRESGSLEQDADVVLFLYRDEVYTKDDCKEEDRGIAELDIAKHRGGPTAMVRLAFLEPYTRFENLAERSDA